MPQRFRRGGVLDSGIIIFLLERAGHELLLFAAVAFAVGGVSDLAIDAIWLGRHAFRSMTIYRRHARVHVGTLTPAEAPGSLAIFVPAWDESAVIGSMLAHAVATLGSGDGADWRIYVGVYPNDPATAAEVAPHLGHHVRMARVAHDGSTTKADCLNAIWQQMVADERAENRRFKAVVLHDAEDVVHPAERAIFDALIERCDLVQLPVLPLVDGGSRWVAGHYIDEFADNHGKTIVTREAIGAGIPSAGVGCAIARDMLARIADARGGQPFDAGSLTEDYELGLRVAELGGRGVFVRMRGATDGRLVAVRAHFPGHLDAAVRQKARWIAGIALSGWDRLGWRGGFAERWMRLHDRRSVMAAVVMLAAYVALVLGALANVARWLAGSGASEPPMSRAFAGLLWLCFALLIWRLAMRAWLVTASYGWREGIRSIPRTVVGNIIAMIAARRAIGIYAAARRNGRVVWDKTDHHFPADAGNCA